ncbi:protein kinase domain-containing protein [Promicromonospora sp. CA-289599]|uniref:protein kinase domain-containing protein n=1 Tax=Promicromonospora sp. CA-289599 TaxID=3240014 RepID=UPI003D8E2EFE
MFLEPLGTSDPASVGPYRLLGRLGRGGMGVVYLGRSRGGRDVAVKVVSPELSTDDQFRRRFEREVAAARRVGGFYTAAVVDADTGAYRPWMATSYIPGPTLQAAVDAQGPFTVEAVRAIGAGLAEGLATIHAAGLVHRDLKPANIVVAADGPRVIDFGITRALDSASVTTSRVLMGTPAYMPPEQALGGEVTAAGDVFSLGGVLAFAATGSSPFGDGRMEAMVYRLVHAEPDLAAVPPELRDLVAACLAKDPAARPGVEDVLEGLADGDASNRPWLTGPVAEMIAERDGIATAPSARLVSPVSSTPSVPQVPPVSPAGQASSVPLVGPVDAPPRDDHDPTNVAATQLPTPASPEAPAAPAVGQGDRKPRRGRGFWAAVAGGVVVVAAGAVLAAVLLNGRGDEPVDVVAAAADCPSASTEERATYSLPDASAAQGRTWEVVLDTCLGEIGLELDGATAPHAVASFLTLADGGYFDGTGCHRLYTGEVSGLQCGDPTFTGTGGPGYRFGPLENAPEDGVYPAGTLAMARSTGDADSMGSQFYLVFADSHVPPDSAGGYTVFGRVTSGLDVLRAVGAEGVQGAAADGPPEVPVTIERVEIPAAD